MKKLKRVMVKLGIAIAILVLNFLVFFNSVAAKDLEAANIYMIGDCGTLLAYQGIPVKVSYVQYTENQVDFPAYCLDKTKPGAESGEYTVSIKEFIQDVGLWRRVINGYPYKTVQELGVANKEEAFTATKQAIYCYIHGNNPSDYSPIGEGGERTLRAMLQIITAAENSSDVKLSSQTWLKEESSKWEQDEREKTYVSKLFSVEAQAEIQDYQIEIQKENECEIPGIKIVSLDYDEKNQFQPNEKFKILIPIQEMKKEGEFKLIVKAKVKTKPVLYGVAPNNDLQDYALTMAAYEDGIGECEQKYPLNETEIVILKKDEATYENLKGVEFVLMNEKKEIIRQSLKTDVNGKISIKNLLPGKYYLKEISTLNGYQEAEDLIELEVAWEERLIVTVYNQKEKKPEVEVERKESTKEVKRLPITGM